MTFFTLTWLFVLAVGLHNLEEALWLPAWSERAGRWCNPVGAREFRFAVVILTAAAAVAALAANIALGPHLATMLLWKSPDASIPQ
jgi:uncharacterized protein with HXXEE motif